MSFTIVAITSGILLVFTTLLFLYERSKGRRYGERARMYVDNRINTFALFMRTHVPSMNSRFFRQLLHYITNRILAGVLFLVRKIEQYISAAMRFNRFKARRITHGTSDEHLVEIAEHKRKAQLSEKEKREHKDRALKGE